MHEMQQLVEYANGNLEILVYSFSGWDWCSVRKPFDLTAISIKISEFLVTVAQKINALKYLRLGTTNEERRCKAWYSLWDLIFWWSFGQVHGSCTPGFSLAICINTISNEKSHGNVLFVTVGALKAWIPEEMRCSKCSCLHLSVITAILFCYLSCTSFRQSCSALIRWTSDVVSIWLRNNKREESRSSHVPIVSNFFFM